MSMPSTAKPIEVAELELMAEVFVSKLNTAVTHTSLQKPLSDLYQLYL